MRRRWRCDWCYGDGLRRNDSSRRFRHDSRSRLRESCFWHSSHGTRRGCGGWRRRWRECLGGDCAWARWLRRWWRCDRRCRDRSRRRLRCHNGSGSRLWKRCLWHSSHGTRRWCGRWRWWRHECLGGDRAWTWRLRWWWWRDRCCRDRSRRRLRYHDGSGSWLWKCCLWHSSHGTRCGCDGWRWRRRWRCNRCCRDGLRRRLWCCDGSGSRLRWRRLWHSSHSMRRGCGGWWWRHECLGGDRAWARRLRRRWRRDWRCRDRSRRRLRCHNGSRSRLRWRRLWHSGHGTRCWCGRWRRRRHKSFGDNRCRLRNNSARRSGRRRGRLDSHLWRADDRCRCWSDGRNGILLWRRRWRGHRHRFRRRRHRRRRSRK